MTTREQKTMLVSIIAVLGVLIPVWQFIFKYDAKILFDEANSLIVTIKSENQILNNKFILLLYRLTVVGKGEEKFSIKNVSTSIRCSGNWYSGVYFTPEQVAEKDQYGNPIPSLYLSSTEDTVHLLKWDDFKPGDSVLDPGQQDSFSYAAYFPLFTNNYKNCDKLKIEAEDYLGNKKITIRQTDELFNLLPDFYIKLI